MNDWIKILFMLGGMAVTMYVVQREHAYRLEVLEKGYQQHLQLHEQDLNELKKDINQIKVDIARLAVNPLYSKD